MDHYFLDTQYKKSYRYNSLIYLGKWLTSPESLGTGEYPTINNFRKDTTKIRTLVHLGRAGVTFKLTASAIGLYCMSRKYCLFYIPLYTFYVL